MKLRILSSCTGEKRYSPAGQLTRTDFRLLNTSDEFRAREAELAAFRVSAEDMYTGLQHARLMQGVYAVRALSRRSSVNVWILSAGYGLIAGDQQIVPYECTFRGMRAAEVDAWSRDLGIPSCAKAFFAEPAHLTLVLLGDDYLRALALDRAVYYASPTIFLTAKSSEQHVQGFGSVRSVVLSTSDTQRFSCGVIGLKGEIARRLLLQLAQCGKDIPDLLDERIDMLSWLSGAR